jgi:hypothetical protein
MVDRMHFVVSMCMCIVRRVATFPASDLGDFANVEKKHPNVLLH